MAFAWSLRPPERPDRYLDWEVLNSRAANRHGALPRRWCSALIRIEGDGQVSLANLRRLKGEIGNRLASTGGRGEAQRPTIAMHADEVALLDAQISALQATGRPQVEGDVGMQFFVYLPEEGDAPEEGAYANGGFARRQHYRIVHVGPPIEGLRFDPEVRLAPRLRRSMRPAGRCAIGIIDDSIAFANERFRRRDPTSGIETTRVSRLWLQDLEHFDGSIPRELAFGLHLDRGDINAAFRAACGASGDIDEARVYRTLGLIDFGRQGRNALARRISHGTHVMDLACGFDRDDAAGGLRPIFAVQLPDAATADTSGITMGSYVLQGLRQIMLWADQRGVGPPLPLVVNFSYGMYAGPKDGRHWLEREIDRLIAHRNRFVASTAVVLPSGNAYRRRSTVRMTLSPGEMGEVDWVVLPDDGSPNFVEVWFDWDRADTSPLELRITSPDGDHGPDRMPAAGTGTVATSMGRPVIGVYFDTPATIPSPDGPGAQSCIFLAINPTRRIETRVARAEPGAYRLAMMNVGQRPISFEMTIQRDDAPSGAGRASRQSYFDHPNAYERDAATGDYRQLGSRARPTPISHQGTLSAIGNGKLTVVVGAAEAGDRLHASDYCSSGPTKGRSGPDFAAVADDSRAFPGVLAAGPRSGATVLMSGTSVAAPRITRLLADCGADVERLAHEHGAGSVRDPRLGRCVAPHVPNAQIPQRRRGARRSST